jgi:hypothetical protein
VTRFRYPIRRLSDARNQNASCSGRSLRSSGFERVRDLTPTTTQIADWMIFNLGTESDGTIYKPDSLYGEGSRA